MTESGVYPVLPVCHAVESRRQIVGVLLLYLNACLHLDDSFFFIVNVIYHRHS